MSFGERIKNAWENLKYNLRVVYRFTVLNDGTYETVRNFKMSLGRFVFLASVPSIILISIVTLLLFFSPLRKLIPGYPDDDLRKRQGDLLKLANDLERKIAERDTLLQSLTQLADAGRSSSASTSTSQTAQQTQTQSAPQAQTAQSQDQQEVSVSDVQPASSPPTSSNNTQLNGSVFRSDRSFRFIKPVDGFLTNKFRPGDNHFAIDLAASQNSSIQSISDGYVFFSDYTTETGHVIGIAHANNFISFYKHNRTLYKKVGSFVFAGETIAMIGNSGENSTGPHLHFELWHNGKPIDPTEFMTFKSY